MFFDAQIRTLNYSINGTIKGPEIFEVNDSFTFFNPKAGIIFNINEDVVWWSASVFGWIVGHSYIVYAPLFYGCTTVLFEGKPVGTPDAGVFWRVISEHLSLIHI